MPYCTTDDGVRLHYEATGEGHPVLFIHEFGGNHRSWEPQLRYFARRYRCITYAARGYPPSDVPEDVSRYSQERAVDDAVAVLDALAIDRAHVVGLSMGGFAALHLGLHHPDRATSLVIAAVGYGAEKEHESFFRNLSNEVADNFEQQGSEQYASVYARAAARIPFLVKDPRGWEEFARMLSGHSAIGAANTMRGVQAARLSLYDLEKELACMRVPSLIVNGDEDDHCLNPGIFLKKTLPASGLTVLPKTGHTINLEEPAQFNELLSDFFARVEAGRWPERDPRSNPAEIMKTS